MPGNNSDHSHSAMRSWEIAALLFAGLGAAIAGVALWLQLGVNKRVLEGLAFERVEALRGTGVNVLNDWSTKRLNESGIPIDQWSLRGLTLLGKSAENKRTFSIGQLGASDHREVQASRVHLILQSELPLDFSDATFSNVRITGSFRGHSFKDALFQDVELCAVSLRDADFSDARFTRSATSGNPSPTLASLFGFDPDEPMAALRGTDFRGTTFVGYEFHESEFASAVLDSTTTFTKRQTVGPDDETSETQLADSRDDCKE